MLQPTFKASVSVEAYSSIEPTTRLSSLLQSTYKPIKPVELIDRPITSLHYSQRLKRLSLSLQRSKSITVTRTIRSVRSSPLQPTFRVFDSSEASRPIVLNDWSITVYYRQLIYSQRRSQRINLQEPTLDLKRLQQQSIESLNLIPTASSIYRSTACITLDLQPRQQSTSSH